MTKFCWSMITFFMLSISYVSVCVASEYLVDNVLFKQQLFPSKSWD